MDEITHYTVEDVARLTGLTTRTIRNYLKSGALHGQKVGAQWRFTQQDVDALFREAEPDPVAAFLHTKAHSAPAACAIVDLPAPDEAALAPQLQKLEEKLTTYAEPPVYQYHYDQAAGCARFIFSGDLKKVTRLLRQFRREE